MRENQRKKSKKSRSKTCTVKHRLTTLAKPLAYIFDIVWAIGASVVAVMASPLLIH
ncbi:hypothetical protein [Sneathiella sp.]|uniref:hypothetical protein n=1 Tax=Sneathiella sp. TaxID=1964365 RepID=UPI0025FAA487|nr:hypothetical protein [Sneathiella sp.]